MQKAQLKILTLSAAVVRKDSQFSGAGSALQESQFRICAGALATVRPKTYLDLNIFAVGISLCVLLMLPNMYCFTWRLLFINFIM
jgi:hypothetical protein